MKSFLRQMQAINTATIEAGNRRQEVFRDPDDQGFATKLIRSILLGFPLALVLFQPQSTTAHRPTTPSDSSIVNGKTTTISPATNPIKAQTDSGQEIIFVDSAVRDIEAYLPQRSSNQIVYELHRDHPLAEMAQVLQNHHQVKAIHIISHGQTGQLILGGQTYDGAKLRNYQSELKLIGRSLREGGDILLYGCNIGKTPDTISTLSKLTGVDIAASNNPTGDTDQGGDWRLEVATGKIETAAIAVPLWHGLLWGTAVETVGWFGDSPALTPNATILAPGPFSSAGANIGGAGVTFSMVQVSVPVLASVQKLQNVTSTTFAEAQTNNDFIYSDLTVGSTGLLITMQYNQVSSTYNTAATAKMGVTITDTTAGGAEMVLNNTGVNLQGTSTLLPVALNSPASNLLPNHTYRVKFYMWGCGASNTCYVDNPKFYTQLNQAPTANAVTAASQPNPGGTTAVQVPALNGTDPEDSTLGTGDSFQIITLPTNGTLYYNNVAVTANQVISSYDPTKLTLDPTATSADTVTFTYRAIDSLTAVSSAATVTMPFTAQVSYDFGDAPDTYGTLLANNGARHTISSLFLGAGVSSETNGQPNPTATGDTNDDGVTFSPTLGANYSTLIQAGITNQVTVVSSGAGFVNAWVDYNQNGTFDSGEQILTNQAVVAGNNTLTFTPANNILHGSTFTRFRLSPTTVASPSPVGQITGGEVEDYQVTIAAPVPNGAACSTTGLLNGGFETPVIAANSFNIMAKSLVPGWNTSATDQSIELWSTGFAGGGNPVPSYAGNQFAEMNANQKASLYQDIATVPGATLTFQFAHRARATTSSATVDSAAVGIGVPGGTLVQQGIYKTDSTDWVVYRSSYVVPAGQYITRVQFDSLTSGYGDPLGSASVGNFLDDVQFSVNSCVTPVSPPTLDLDGNNSTAAGNNYTNTFFIGGAAVAAADTDVVITDEKTNITRATIQLINIPDGATESLTIDPTAGGTVTGVTVDLAYSYSASGAGQSVSGRLTLKGSASLSNYQKILTTLKYNNTKVLPTLTDRQIEVQVIDSDKLSSNTAISTIKLANSVSISGTVFEDPNYGGGAGRSLSTAGTSPRSGARVEIYNKATGLFVATTTTNSTGQYTFPGLSLGDYLVRVVNSTVTSSRGTSTGLVPVQTFRVDHSTGTLANDPNRVGGEKPSVVDTGTGGVGAVLNPTTFAFTTAPIVVVAGNATVGGQAESISVVKVSSGVVTGIDFGYNFDTIVNTNDSGQGSLRQFIINSNALPNAGLDQVPNPNPFGGTTAVDPAAGEETSIFMIPVTALTSNVAVITPITGLPAITDTFTTINGLTQTANIGNTNGSQQGAGGLVGIDNLTLNQVNKPEVQIVGNNTIGNGLTLAAANNTIRGISIYGFGNSVITGNIAVSPNIANTLIEQNFVGTTATSFSAPAINNQGNNIYLDGGSNNGLIQNNLVGYAGYVGIFGHDNNSGWTVKNNEVRGNALGEPSKDGVSFELGSSNNLVKGNLIIANAGVGVDSFNGTGTLTVENNTIIGNGVGNTTGGPLGDGIGETPGIRVFGTGNKIDRNIIANNYGAGVMVRPTSQQTTITKNSIYGNGTIAATNGQVASGQIGIDLLKNTDNGKLGTSIYVTANDGPQTTNYANQGMNYPVINFSKINNGTLTVKGFVGKIASGSNTFANANLEFFVSEGTNLNLGEVILGDTRQKSHGEGKTYIGSCTADANSQFNCTFTNVLTTSLDPFNITATATLNNNTSEFSATPYKPANVQLLKRITGIKNPGGTFGTTNPNKTSVALNTIDNTNSSFPANYVVGAVDAGIVKPGDEIEYTVYYVNNGENAAKLKICDLLDPNLVFNPDGFDTGTNTGHGIQLQLGTSTPLLLTSVIDPTVDRAHHISGAPGTTISGCNLAGNQTTTNVNNASGTVVIDINSSSASDTSTPILLAVPGTGGTTIPNNSYGSFKFRAKIKQ